jgi:hypothetical protein
VPVTASLKCTAKRIAPGPGAIVKTEFSKDRIWEERHAQAYHPDRCHRRDGGAGRGAGAKRTARAGTNGVWCMPDSPATPGPDPMCGDANAMEWAMAWIGKTEPPKGKVGFM